MEKVLVVSSLAKGTALLTSLLKEEEVALHYAASGGEARLSICWRTRSVWW